MTLNSILFARKKYVEVVPGNSNNMELVNAIAANLAVYGYALSSDLHKTLATLSEAELTEWNTFLNKECSESVGAHVKHKPLFRRFPEDVPATREYLLERIIGYFKDVLRIEPKNGKLLSCGHMIDTNQFDLSNFGACPICQMQVNEVDLEPAKPRQRAVAEENYNLKFIGLAPKNAGFDLFTNLIGAKSSISEQDAKYIRELMAYYANYSSPQVSGKLTFTSYAKKIAALVNNENIFHKEVLAITVAACLENLLIPNYEFKNITDVLRVATALSKGDVSLATNTKFISFQRPIRKQLLKWLDNCVNIEEDLTRHANRWVALAERLHPGEFAKVYKNFYSAISKIRNNETIEKFSTLTDRFLKAKDVRGLANHLKTRPTEYGRRLDFMLSNTSEADTFLKEFTALAKTIPTATLLQISANFNNRHEKKSERFFFPKGQLAKIQVVEEDRIPLSVDVCNKVRSIIEKVLAKRFAKFSSMGKVYIDRALSSYIVPFNERSASKALHTIVRGSRVPLPDVSTMRFFIYWKQPDGVRTDLDLSAGMFDENWNFKERIAFTNYHAYNCTHSGDIQSAPNGASEFIDIDRESALKAGIRYVFMIVYSYTMTPLVQLPTCFAGVMGRKEPKSNEIFEPTTVEHKFDLTADTNVAMPLILDLKTSELIWTDISMQNNRNFIEGNSNSIGKVGSVMSQMTETKYNLYDLLKLHAENRGTLVENREEADVVFDTTNIPFENDKIVSEYLAS